MFPMFLLGYFSKFHKKALVNDSYQDSHLKQHPKLSRQSSYSLI